MSWHQDTSDLSLTRTRIPPPLGEMELGWKPRNTIDPQTLPSIQFSLSVVSDSATPWTAARQASLSITNSLSLLKLMSIESVMPSNHLILCCPLHFQPPIPPSIRVFSMSLFKVLLTQWMFCPFVCMPLVTCRRNPGQAPHLWACSLLEGVFLLKHFHFSFLISLLCLWIILQWRKNFNFTRKNTSTI